MDFETETDAAKRCFVCFDTSHKTAHGNAEGGPVRPDKVDACGCHGQSAILPVPPLKTGPRLGREPKANVMYSDVIKYTRASMLLQRRRGFLEINVEDGEGDV